MFACQPDPRKLFEKRPGGAAPSRYAVARRAETLPEVEPWPGYATERTQGKERVDDLAQRSTRLRDGFDGRNA